MRSSIYILSLMMAIFSMSVSCNTENENGTTINDLAGNYVGAMNVLDVSFQNVQYGVTVSVIGSSQVRFTPESTVASTWDASTA